MSSRAGIEKAKLNKNLAVVTAKETLSIRTTVADLPNCTREQFSSDDITKSLNDEIKFREAVCEGVAAADITSVEHYNSEMWYDTGC